MSFSSLMDEVMADAPRFGHREHVHLTWLAVRSHGVPGATDLISEGIRRVGGAKYHATVTRAWVELVGSDFDTFIRGNPALLDKDLLLRYYSPEVLASGRDGWVAPDKAPLP
ncbi:hypothetical protein [Cryptosporangium sp. NPDC048952]|uniref:hypothetical protein n=1 Tax=Cryptosporangium sp. NPDC048952 TaxID=3363961 RepID=UPI003713BD44